MPIGASLAPNDRYMQWAWIWRKQVWLGEKWSIVGEKKLNHCFPKRQLSSATSASYKTWKNLGTGQDHFQITMSGSGGRDHEYWSRQELDSVTVSQTPTVTMTAGQCSDSQHPSSVTRGVRLATCQLQVDRVFACIPTGKTGSQAPQWKAIYTNIAWKCYIQHG